MIFGLIATIIFTIWTIMVAQNARKEIQNGKVHPHQGLVNQQPLQIQLGEFPQLSGNPLQATNYPQPQAQAPGYPQPQGAGYPLQPQCPQAGHQFENTHLSENQQDPPPYPGSPIDKNSSD